MKNDNLKIWIVDDHSLFRNGLKLLLNNIPNYKVTGEAANGVEFLNLLQKEMPDIVLLDIEMPEMDGITAAEKALSLHPELKIITLSMYGEQEYYSKMMEIGASGFLLKNSDINEVKSAIETVWKGGNYFSKALMSELIQSLKTINKPTPHKIDLSQREIEIIAEICKGLSNQEIGEQLFISKRTVEKHRANILAKTNCKNTASLVVFAIKNNLFTID